MCGIVGLLSKGGGPVDGPLAAMTGTLRHRGPDAGDVWLDREAGIGLGHRRLAIVDLSAAGAQPMHSADGRWVIVYNGELYNTEDLRAELAAHGRTSWRGHSDTEVMLEAVSQWGVADATRRFNGIFAFALWDKAERALWLVRDRLGVKPLYWGRLDDGTILFGSELRALRAHPRFHGAINPAAVAAYLRHACIPAPATIYRSVFKLPPAHLLKLSPHGEPALDCYWNLRAIAAEGHRNPDLRSETDMLAALDALLEDAVGRQMVSDVPLGAFLSGGIDSSLVVALMQGRSSRPVKTYSIGFSDPRYNEADAARAVARHLETEHTELIVEAGAARDVIPRLPDIYDEPFADSSQIPTFLVSQLARQNVTVALSGDGGDEGFAGYTRYQWIDRLARGAGAVPLPLRRGAARAITALSSDAWDTLLSPVPRRLRPTHVGDKIHKGAALLGLAGADAMYDAVIAQWGEPERVVRGLMPAGMADDRGLARDIPDVIARLRYRDMMTYLPDDILTKVDRASMAVSLEVRVPLLDHRVLEFAWRQPSATLVQGGIGKLPLRRILERRVPRALFDRPKQGFGIPLGEWLRGPLRDWCHDLLSETALAESGMLEPGLIRQRLEEHQSGRRNWQYALWTVLMFQSWHRRWA